VIGGRVGRLVVERPDDEQVDVNHGLQHADLQDRPGAWPPTL
jgi:hypothetical protein